MYTYDDMKNVERETKESERHTTDELLEHLLQGRIQLLIPVVRLQVNLAPKRDAVHVNLNKTGL
jgi:hypothetical protein